MRYNYKCQDGCKFADIKDKCGLGDLTKITFIQVSSGDLVWEESHKMSEDPEILCPLCGKKAKKTMEGMNMPVAYIRGNGYLDKKGCLRDMNLYKLENNQDPYSHMRQPGEVDELKTKLKKAGKHNPNKKYYLS